MQHTASPADYDFPNLRAPQVAERLDISEATLYRLLQRAEAPPSYKVGRSRLWRECDVVAWLEAECREPRERER